MARRAAARKLRGIAPKGARVSAYPGFVSYCDPTLSEQAPRGDGWAHEIKADGYRAQVHVVEGKVIVYSRRGHDWTDQFGAIAQARPGACLLQSACRASRRYRPRPVHHERHAY